MYVVTAHTCGDHQTQIKLSAVMQPVRDTTTHTYCTCLGFPTKLLAKFFKYARIYKRQEKLGSAKIFPFL